MKKIIFFLMSLSIVACGAFKPDAQLKIQQRSQNADQIWVDGVSGLQWTSVQAKSQTWQMARATCGDLSWNGAQGWRLPTKNDLVAAFEHGIRFAGSSFDELLFWSSSSYSRGSDYRWIMDLMEGEALPGYKNDDYAVLCIK